MSSFAARVFLEGLRIVFYNIGSEMISPETEGSPQYGVLSAKTVTVPDKPSWALYLCAQTRRGLEKSTNCRAGRVRGCSPGLRSGRNGLRPRLGGNQRKRRPGHRARTSADSPRARGAGSPTVSRRQGPAATPLTPLQEAQHHAGRGQPLQPQGTPGTGQERTCDWTA